MDFKKILSSFLSRNSKTEEKKTSLTSDNKKIKWEDDNEPLQLSKAYKVLSKEERARKIVTPFRLSYVHKICNTPTSMVREIPETYTNDPEHYGYTYCVQCQMYHPTSEFIWEDSDETVRS